MKGSPIVDEALLRIAALYKIEDSIRGCDPDHRRAVRQNLSRPLVDEFFTWLAAQAARVSATRPSHTAICRPIKDWLRACERIGQSRQESCCPRPPSRWANRWPHANCLSE